MSDHCDVCGRRNTWGCGHTGRQRWAARRHNATAAHREERCWHYTDPPRPGWFPAQHSAEYLARQIPEDFPVRPLGPDDAAKDRVTCGECGRSWDDAIHPHRDDTGT